MRRGKPASGFTLIEVAVTMGIFAIMVALGVPAMRTWVSNTKVRAVSDVLQNGLRQAQAESLRRSRQVVFAFTNTTTPGSYPVAAVANGTSWVAYALPSMTDGLELPTFIASGVLSNASANVSINTGAVAAVCFNSVGRLVNNNSASVTAVTGGAACVTPTSNNPPSFPFTITTGQADRPLEVQLGLAGQVHMCYPTIALTATYSEGCQ